MVLADVIALVKKAVVVLSTVRVGEVDTAKRKRRNKKIQWYLFEVLG